MEWGGLIMFAVLILITKQWDNERKKEEGGSKDGQEED